MPSICDKPCHWSDVADMSVRTWAEAISIFQISNGSISHPLGWWSVCISNIISLSHSLSLSPPRLTPYIYTQYIYIFKNYRHLIYIYKIYIHIIGIFPCSALGSVNKTLLLMGFIENMCVYIYSHTCVCVHTYTHGYIHIHIYVHVYYL